ncbi:MAG: DUF4394 domain-containing protein [Pseudomonadota bacterium]
MRRFPFSKVLALIAVSTGLAACGGNAPILSTPVSAANAYLLTSNNRIIGVDLDDLEYARSVAPVAQATTAGTVGALDPSEEILDIDYRNSEGQLYALTRTILGSTVTARIVTIAPASGALARVSTLTGVTLSASDTYSIDFNPAVDRLRIISSSGRNIKVNVLTGAASMDSDINPVIAQTGVAYTDTFTAGSTAGRTTLLFGLDSATDKIYTINPSSGALSAGVTLGIDTTKISGFDIDPSAQRGGVAILTVAGQAQVYTINTQAVSNAATLKGKLFNLIAGETFKGLSLITSANPTVLALDAANGLYSFNAQTPAQLSAKTAVTLPNNATLLGIDFSIKDGVLYGLGNDGLVYDLTTSKSPTAAKNNTVIALGALNRTIEITPIDGRLRIVRSAENTSDLIKLSDGTSTPGTVTPATSNIAAAAYSENYAGITATRLFAIDLTTNRFLFQDESSTTTADMTLTTGVSLGISPIAPVGFDISGRGNENLLLMARVAGTTPFNLYRVSPFDTLNPLTLIGQIGTLTNLVDIAIQQ